MHSSPPAVAPQVSAPTQYSYGAIAAFTPGTSMEHRGPPDAHIFCRFRERQWVMSFCVAHRAAADSWASGQVCSQVHFLKNAGDDPAEAGMADGQLLER